MIKYIFSLLLLSCSFFVYAQDKYETIKGNVRTTEGEVAEYVHVTLLNTNYGCITDQHGNFHFKAPAGNYIMAIFSVTTKRKEFTVTIKKGVTNTFTDLKIEEEKHYLNEVVVTGTRTARLLKDSPVLTGVISGVEIEESGAVTALDALENFVPGVMFTPNAMGDNINIAGLDNKYVLVLIDGERMVNERTENVNFSRLNTSDIQQIEVINGASSVLYGSNAIGAVINIITKDVNKPIQGNVHARYSRFNSFVGDASLGFKIGGFTSKTTFSSKSSDGYDSNRANVASDFTMNPYADLSVGEVLKYKINEKLNVEMRGNYYRNETWFLHKYQTRVDHNYTVGGKIAYAFTPENVLTFSGNTDNYRGNQVYKRANDSTVYVNGSGYTTFRLLDAWDATKNIQVVSGAELNLENCFSENQFGDSPEEQKADNWNLFTQGEFKTETGLSALVGARYTRHSQFGGYLSPKISLMYKLNDFRFRANISNGFKAPTIKEMYMVYPHKIGDDVPFWIIGNSDLVPEESWYKAISAEYLGNKLNISVDIHGNSIQNKIITEQEWNPTLNRTELKYKNVEDAKITGVDFSLQWSFLKHFQMKAGYAFAHAVDKTTNLQLLGNSKHNVTCNLVFKQSHLPFLSLKTGTSYSLILSGRFMSSRILNRDIIYDTDDTTILGIEETKSGNYYVTNFIYNQRFPIYKELKGDLQFGINNLLNYINHDSASSNPGRTYFVSLGIKF